MLEPEDFIKWLEEYLAGRTELTPEQTQKVNEKLDSVFDKVTPTLSFGSFDGFRPLTGKWNCIIDNISC